MTERRFLCNCLADKGSVVINGIAFSNIGGDGLHRVYYVDEVPAVIELTKYEGIWIDLRDGNKLMIWGSDCYSDTANEIELDCNAVEVYHSNHNIYLVKHF